ncbi:MAG: hypothetical protein LAT50_11560, partial [Ectothiorhodospiraceae bacterium]|nr:hypothetical protein [Ectothiorhodospiraceae bacterium]
GSDPLALAGRWAGVAGVDVWSGETVAVLRLANAELRFVQTEDGRGDGLAALDLRVKNRARLLSRAETLGLHVADQQVVLCGTRFNLVE